MATTSQLVTRVDFVRSQHATSNAACAFYGDTVGLSRSVYVPERNYAEFETNNVTISIVDGEKMGIGHHVQTLALALHVDDVAAARATSKSAECIFRARYSTPACATWASSPIPTVTR